MPGEAEKMLKDLEDISNIPDAVMPPTKEELREEEEQNFRALWERLEALDREVKKQYGEGAYVSARWREMDIIYRALYGSIYVKAPRKQGGKLDFHVQRSTIWIDHPDFYYKDGGKNRHDYTVRQLDELFPRLEAKVKEMLRA